MKSVLIRMSKSPLSGLTSGEQLETAMVAATFEQEVSILFIGEGVFNLLPAKETKEVEGYNIGKMLLALPTFEVNDLFVCERSLDHRQIEVSSLPKNVRVIAFEEQRRLFETTDVVLSA
tara:strand:+ start:697 stop:1053 length:357 start_codon:yes stop_codon:yes gene_type:complete